MSYSKGRFAGVLSISTAVVLVMLVLIFFMQVAVGLLPVVGVGGILLQADSFKGNNGLIYPQYGQTAPPSHGVTDTSNCMNRPMLVFQLDGATVNGYQVYKDVKLPYFEDQWMTVRIDQATNSIEGNQIRIFTTQLAADRLALDNVEISEGESQNKWGPQSGEFLMKGDPKGNVDPVDLNATGVTTWVHAITGQSVSFVGESNDLVTIDVWINSTTDLENRYSTEGILDDAETKRENYFDCIPGRSYQRDKLLQEDFEGGTVPAGWSAEGSVTVNQNTSNSGSYSARLDGSQDVLTTPTVDLSGVPTPSANFWLRMGDDGFSENPDNEEYIVVEYRTENGDWSTIQTYEGGDQGVIFDRGVSLPEGAKHANFALRFRTFGGSNDFDYWHVDDVVIGG